MPFRSWRGHMRCCIDCGAIVDTPDLELHEQWHQRTGTASMFPIEQDEDVSWDE